jgi:predicted nucleic acid-binding protein
MKIFFVDTNVLLDLLADRKPFSKHAVDIFNAAELEKIQLFTSSHSIHAHIKTDIHTYYFFS